MSEAPFQGILCIGDPHLCTWAPGYRKDDYPKAVLNKLGGRWNMRGKTRCCRFCWATYFMCHETTPTG
jgi:hypothetical protein